MQITANKLSIRRWKIRDDTNKKQLLSIRVLNLLDNTGGFMLIRSHYIIYIFNKQVKAK